MSVDVWVVLSNIALVIVTALAIMQAVKEGHRHEEAETAMVEKLARELVKVTEQEVKQVAAAEVKQVGQEPVKQAA
jgi:glucose-6-phosphate-specific signal transduction histidine kinase